jgi:hypothetical protein
MNIKRFMVFATAMMVAAAVIAAPTKSSSKKGGKSTKAAAAAAEEDNGPEAKVRIDQTPKLGRSATLTFPGIDGPSTLNGRVFTKPRQWIVLETKYTTYDKTTEQLTFEWHVLLQTDTATNKDRDALAKRAPYSYLTQTVTYVNIPRGGHAASVCLHPSYLEQFGEPRAVGVVIRDSKGNILEGRCESETAHKEIATVKSIEDAFWMKDNIMNAKADAEGNPMIERRQGLMDRSKTVWALVNSNDYELVQ